MGKSGEFVRYLWVFEGGMKAIWLDDVLVKVLCILFPSFLSSIQVFSYLLLSQLICFQYPSFISPFILSQPLFFF